MAKNNIRRVYQTTKEANAILTKAGGVMLKSSFNTAKQIAKLYKDAGFKAFNFGKEVVKKTVELTVNNQKEMFKTSGTAIKEVVQHIRENEVEVKKAVKRKVKKNGRQKGQVNSKKELTIDDLLD